MADRPREGLKAGAEDGGHGFAVPGGTAAIRLRVLAVAVEHVICDSPGTPDTAKGFLRAALDAAQEPYTAMEAAASRLWAECEAIEDSEAPDAYESVYLSDAEIAADIRVLIGAALAPEAGHPPTPSSAPAPASPGVSANTTTGGAEAIREVLQCRTRHDGPPLAEGESLSPGCPACEAVLALDRLTRRLSGYEQAREWTVKQLDGCIEMTETFMVAIGASTGATARALIGDLKDARAALSGSTPEAGGLAERVAELEGVIYMQRRAIESYRAALGMETEEFERA